jgi:K+-transporting ATPase ATPase C chain
MALVTIVALGLVYPVAVWAVGAIVAPHQASGSLVTASDGAVVGSALIAQAFVQDRYFHPRPSAAGSNGYDAMSSSPSNLGPTNKVLVSAIESRVADVIRTDGVASGRVPVDAVTASGSGLDPDISPDNAASQVARVARARGVSEDQVRQLVAQHTAGRDLGFLGEPRVNVLELNIALDRQAGK